MSLLLEMIVLFTYCSRLQCSIPLKKMCTPRDIKLVRLVQLIGSLGTIDWFVSDQGLHFKNEIIK